MAGTLGALYSVLPTDRRCFHRPTIYISDSSSRLFQSRRKARLVLLDRERRQSLEVYALGAGSELNGPTMRARGFLLNVLRRRSWSQGVENLPAAWPPN
jgi:hypothetical protein